jgi:NAD(P)-dependent dehydrogenase (short-subunit alcohol dehydrogenase family)
MDVETWRQVFDTNVIGASLVTAAALPYLTESGGTAVYLSSVSASVTPPWPGLGAYAVSKAALDKLVEAWRGEHPAVGFTRVVVGECMGGEGDSTPGFADSWDQELAADVMPVWFARNYMSGSFVGVEDLITVVHTVLQHGGGVAIPSVTVAGRAAGEG